MRFINRYLVALIYCLFCVPAYADNWEPFSGAETLHEFISGATAEIELRPNVTAVGHYNADGTARIEVWDEVFDRTWEVVGDDTVCYDSLTERNCFSYERDMDEPGRYRAHNTQTGELYIFQVVSTNPIIAIRETPPGSEGGPATPSAADIAAQLSDPNSNLGTMNFQFDYVAFDGDLPRASSQNAFRATFQPSLPYSLSPVTNLFVRPAVPVIFNQDVPDESGQFDSQGVELGDISFDALVARTLPTKGVVLGAGVVGTLPTATEDSLGRDQWLLGPEVIAAMVRKWGVIGALATHQWDVAGEDDFDTSITGGQYFYAFNLRNGWQINASPTFSYDHEADSDNNLTLPLGIGASKTTIINGRPWKFGLQFWHYIESPDAFGPDWQIRFSVSPVIKLPW